MSVVPLSDEENYAIFTESYGKSMRGLGRDQQLQVLKRLYKTLDSDAPQHYIYETVEGCDELEVIRAGNSLRVYCRLVMGVPHGNKTYNVLFVFYVDDHDYRARPRTARRTRRGATREPHRPRERRRRRRLPRRARRETGRVPEEADRPGVALSFIGPRRFRSTSSTSSSLSR